MALSPAESALLSETCTNMNVAANTCREVLEMLRSLGNTGVVDIATHNNASTPHAAATNLVHMDGNNMVLGSLNSLTSEWAQKRPFSLKYRSDFKNFYCEAYGVSSGGYSSTGWTFGSQFAFTDSSQNLLSLSDVTSDAGKTYLRTGSFDFSGKGSDFSTAASMQFFMGNRESPADFTKGSIEFILQTGSGVFVNTYEFAHVFLAPPAGSTVSLGLNGRPFDTAFFRTAATITSDQRDKLNINDIDSNVVDFVKSLRPVQYKVAQGRIEVLASDEDGTPVETHTTPGVRTHWGFIAQDVKEAMTAAGIEDAAVWCLADKNDPDSKQSLRYEELIAPLVKAVQVLAAKVETLEGK